MATTDLIAWITQQAPGLPVIAYDDGMFSHPVLEKSGEAERFLWFTGTGISATVAQMADHLGAFDPTLPVMINDEGDWRAAAPALADPADYPPHQIARACVLV